MNMSADNQAAGATTIEVQPRPCLAAWTLTLREMIRFLRQRNRIIGAIATPLLFWLLFGAGLHSSFRVSGGGNSGESFWAYFFPGTLAMILLFTAIFATISIIEDRREGFLQSVLVAPLPRWSMVLGKVLGGSLMAMVQGLIFLLLALTIPEVHLQATSLAATVLLMFVIAVGLTSLGFVLAWRMDSVQGFHAIMNLLLMPMWLLSGAFFPVPALALDPTGGVMHWIMRLNPLTYGVAGLRRLMFGPIDLDAAVETFWLPSLGTCWMAALLFAVLAFAIATRISGTRTTGDLL